MNYDYKYTIYELAQNEILQITEYFVNQLNNKTAANNLIENFIQKINIACQAPYLYKLDTNPKLAKKGIRKIPCNNYIIYYKISKKEKSIDIGRIRHERQNNKDINFKNKPPRAFK